MTPWRGDGGYTRVKTIKSDSDSDSDEQKRSPGFSGKNRGVTPSDAAPGVTHPSDATVTEYVRGRGEERGREWLKAHLF